MTPAELKWISSFVADNRAACSARELRFIALVTVGQRSPSEAAKRLGYKSPGASARQICRRPHVWSVQASFVELSKEIIRLTGDEESDNGR